MRHAPSSRHAFSMIELLVVTGLIATLVAILLPAASGVRSAANATQCLSNLRQIGMAIAHYGDDHHGCVVPGDYVGLIDGGTQPGAGSWACILVEGGYLAAPVGDYPAATLEATFPDRAANATSVLRCPEGEPLNAADEMPTSQSDFRGRFFFVRGSDTTHQAVATWYAINAMPRLPGGTLTGDDARPRPMAFLPDFGGGVADWRITRLARLKPMTPLVFDGVWCFDGDHARINARHDHSRDTNLLCADGHADSALATSLPNEAWYVR